MNQNFMTRLRIILHAALAAIVLWTTGGIINVAQAETRLIVQNNGALNAYLKGLETARLHLDGACELLRASIGKERTAAAITLSLNGAKPEIRGLERLGAGEQVLARTSLRVVQALARLGLTAPRGAFILRTEKTGLYVGNAQRGGRIFADPCAGLGHLLKLIIDASGQAPDDLRRAVAGSSGLSALFDRLRQQAEAVANLSRGSRGTALIPSSPGQTPATDFSGTAGISVTGIERRKNGSIVLSLAIDPAAKPGEGAVYGYRLGNRFTPISRFPVRIVDAPALPAPARAATPALAPGSSIFDVVDFGAGSRSFTVTVERPGTLVIESSGSTDLAAGLFGAADQVLVRNDDSGEGYNFRLETPVEPGQFRLDVSHCCGGAGAFGLSVELK